MNRFWQVLLIGSTLAFSWLGMMAVHELGHVLHLWLSGGTVEKVVLHPLEISRTDPGENPHPLVVAWGGPVCGCLIPILLLLLVRAAARSYAYLARFFAGFCLIANGAYLFGDSFVRGGDAHELIGHGTPQWVLIACGLPAIAAGVHLWNGLGPHFGLGRAEGRVDPRAALGVTLTLASLIVLEIVLFGR
ncbi:MAG: M50 family metallopeptidase [Planctomycetota bacterium]